MPEDNQPPPMHTLTLRIPEDWYEVLREDAHKNRADLTDLIRDSLAKRYRFRRFRMVKGARPRIEYLPDEEG